MEAVEAEADDGRIQGGVAPNRAVAAEAEGGRIGIGSREEGKSGAADRAKG